MNYLGKVNFDKNIFVEFVYFLKHDYMRDSQLRVEEHLTKFFDKYYVDVSHKINLSKVIHCVDWVMPNWLKLVEIKNRNDLVVEVLSSSLDNVMLFNGEQNLENHYRSILTKMVNHLLLCSVSDLKDFPEYFLIKEKEDEQPDSV